ncbi:MAG TPA: XrtA system polysaccharide deacetylase [Gemmatimonadales bacterium]
MLRHYFTVDVEEHFQVTAFEDRIPRTEWPRHPSRVAANIDRVLELLAAHDARGTFFVLGLVAERTPEVVGAIHAAGHEVASHGWDHRLITGQTPAEFRESIRRCKRVLEDLTGTPVLGFRAPSYSIVAGGEWALDIIAEEGYQYDSSLFPVRRPGYGYANGARDPHWLERPAGRLAELPPATWRVLGANVPAGGGAYFRIFPYALVRAALRQCEARGVSGVFYVHPWELDPDQPRLRVSFAARLRHYTGLRQTAPRLERLLSEFRFVAIADRFREPAVIAAP